MYKRQLTDDLKRSWPGHVLVINNLFLIASMISFLFLDYNKLIIGYPVLVRISYICFLLILGFSIWGMKYQPKNNAGLMFLILPRIFLFLIYFILLAIIDTTIVSILFLVFILGINLSVFLGAYSDGLHKSMVISMIIITVSLSFFFGKSLYKKMPYQFGGGQPYYIAIVSDKNPNNDTLQVLYENSERLLLMDSKKEITFSLKSSIIKYKIIKIN